MANVTPNFDLDDMKSVANEVSSVMKTLGHQGRLMILCQLADGEKSVGQLSKRLDIAQSPLSQHLSRMRSEGLVKPRREAQTVYYSLKSHEIRQIIQCLYGLYCARE